MPVCTSCGASTPYLYTVYDSGNNLRLEQCSHCRSFTDPYVEQEYLTILLDLILLKPGVFRHLLFNRGSPPRKASHSQAENPHCSNDWDADMTRWMMAVKWGTILIFLDAYTRWSHQYSNHRLWTMDSAWTLLRVFGACLIETVTFHLGIMLASWAVLLMLKHKTMAHLAVKSSSREHLRVSHIPLILFYSSFTKLFLLLLLSVWRQQDSPEVYSLKSPQLLSGSSLAGALFQAFDEDRLDREWVVRNLIGGMAAGFGLRVALDCHPFFTTVIIVFGWVMKTAAGSAASGWIAGPEGVDGRWMVYSIP